MKKLFIFLSILLSISIGYSFAATSIINLSYTTNGDNVTINRTDNSNGGYVDINLQDPQTNDWLHFGEVKISDQTFTYTKQWDGNQKIWMIPGDGGDEIKFSIKGDKSPSTTTDRVKKESSKGEEAGVTRTVITAVPKTGPSGSLIGIILATLAIFGGYIYIRKRADI